MSDMRGATLFEDLPEEIIDKILIRLPSKDVGRCRVVSTSCRSATSTPRFMLEHHRRQPLLPIVYVQGLPTNHVVLGGACSQQLWPFLPDAKQRFKNCLQAACDGFLIISRGLDVSRGLNPMAFYICNPVTRKHALLRWPQIGPADICYSVIGFYRHHPTGEYRVLLFSQPQPWSQSKSSLYVLTVGSDEMSQVRVRMPTVLSPSVEHKLLQKLRLGPCCPPSVHHRGSLHWCPYGANDITGGGGDIIVFDTEAESFRCMHSPTQSCPHRKLFHMKGDLALWGSTTPLALWDSSTPSFTTMDVWVMQDYEAEIWAFKYRIDLSMVEASRQLYFTSVKKKKETPLDSTVECFNDMVVLNERELLIMFNYKHVLHCNIDGKFLGIVNLGKSHYRMSLTQHHLQESIIPIPSHKMQGEDEEPPFYTGHV